MKGDYYWKKNREKFPVVFSCTPIIEAGSVIGGVITFLDMTKHKRDEEIKSMLEAKLMQAQKLEAIGTLAGGIAHDFNNILSPIIGFTEMALRDIAHSSPMRSGLEQVLIAGLRARELVKQILAFSRPGREGEKVPLELSGIVQEVMKLLRASLPVSIEMRQNLEKGCALADATQIHQVLMNLCINAAHAMDDHGVLEVNLDRVHLRESDIESLSLIGLKPGPYLKLSVSDSGRGMDAATIHRIFEPYFTTKEVGKGTGLGLSVVHGIVKRFEGAVSVQSIVAKGTTFSIYIPAIEGEDEDSSMSLDGIAGGKESILLIDDEQIMVELGTMILERLGYQVTPATGSLQALELFRANADRFDLIITDCSMPDMTGTDMAKEIRRIRPGIPIIMCTGFTEKVAPGTAEEFGGLIMKPYIAKDIAELVRKLLDKTG
ncbi:MAG: ATP-binding protein [Syntrophobacteraceae bacterium]